MDASTDLRAHLRDQVTAHLADPSVHLVVLTGVAGVGKTHLLDEVAQSRRATRVWGVESLSDVPLAAVAHLVDPDGSVAGQVRDFVRTAGDLVCVDDLDRLDALSLALVHRLLREPGRRVVATLRTGAGAPSVSLRALLTSPGTRVVTVPLLDRDGTAQLAETLLGAPAAGGLADDLWQRTDGNPLHLVQVVTTARDQAALEQRAGAWHATAALPTPDTLRQALLDRVDALGGPAREAAEFVATLGDLDLSRCEQTGRGAAVSALLAAGILVATEQEEAGRGRVLVLRFSHPLFPEVLRDGMDPVRHRTLLREHLAVEEQRAGDPVRIAVLRLEIGEPGPPDQLLEAARLATGRLDTTSALRLARAAACCDEDEVSAPAAALASDVLLQQGLPDEAVQILRDALARVAPGVDQLLLTVVAHVALLWSTGGPDAADALTEEQLRRHPPDSLATALARAIADAARHFYLGRPAEVLAIFDSLAPWDAYPPQVTAGILQTRAYALTQLGRADEAVRDLRSQAPQPGVPLETSVPGWESSTSTELSEALNEAGLPEQALIAAGRAVDLAAEAGLARGHVMASLAVAGAHLRRGDLAAAEQWASRTWQAARAARMVDHERLALTDLASCTGATGRRLGDPARARWGELAPSPGFGSHRTPVGLAWQALASGDPDQARALLLDGTSRAGEDGALSAEALLAHELLRTGVARPDDVAQVRERLAGHPSGTVLARARLALATGLDEQDPEELERAAVLFGEGGMWLFAAEAGACAAALLDGRAAAALTHRARTARGRVGDPVTPLTTSLGASATLSAREREIAELAVHSSSAQIAARMVLSVRTVDNHLARAYAKLGITGRAGLRDALDR